MSLPEIKYCPGTLAIGFETYSRTCLNRVFNGKKVSHILPYEAPQSNLETDQLYEENRSHISISGVQEKFSIRLEKKLLKLVTEKEQGTHILKPIPNAGHKRDQMPANEHLTMQIARQVYGIETAENALIFFKDGTPAYITKRFDVKEDGTKRAQDDFASLAGRTPQTHGTHYKYEGNYLELFILLKKYIPPYAIESLKLFKLIVFNYLFSNGDAHFKNFSVIETPLGDYKLSPAYDLLNSSIHIDDSDFALKEGLLPKNLAMGKVSEQFFILAKEANINGKQANAIFEELLANSDKVESLIAASYLNEKTKRSYLQAYQTRLKKLKR